MPELDLHIPFWILSRIVFHLPESVQVKVFDVVGAIVILSFGGNDD